MLIFLILNFHQTIQRFTYKYRKNNCRLRMFRLHEGPIWLGHDNRVNRRINCTVRSGKPATSVKEYGYSVLTTQDSYSGPHKNLYMVENHSKPLKELKFVGYDRVRVEAFTILE